MDRFPNKKLNPYLYPFKMKSDILHLHRREMKFPVDNDLCYKEQLLHIGVTNEMATNTVFRPIMTQVPDFTNHIEKETNKYSIFQTKTNFAVPNTIFPENSTVFELPKTATATFERSNNAYENCERPQHNIPLNRSKTCVKTLKSMEALKIPVILIMIGVRLMNSAFQRPVTAVDKPNVMYLDFKRLDVREKPIPKEVNWTRVDVPLKKLDMIPTWTKVVMGLVCGITATVALHPLDVIKVRIQLFPKKVTSLRMLQYILAVDGPSGLWVGLTAGILRQLTYTVTRLAVYHSLYADYRNAYGKYPEFHEGLGMAVVAGLAGAFMGVPSEVALERMIEAQRTHTSRCTPPYSAACKKGHRPEGAIRQLLRIARNEGVATWWRGAVLTLVRSVFVTYGQVGVYTEVREAFTKGDHVFTGPYLHFCTASIASVVSTILSLPVDQVKTRCQSYKERHRHEMDIFTEILRKKGLWYLWKGFLPYYVRQVVHTMITNIMLDQLIDAYTHADYREANEQNMETETKK